MLKRTVRIVQSRVLEMKDSRSVRCVVWLESQDRRYLNEGFSMTVIYVWKTV